MSALYPGQEPRPLPPPPARTGVARLARGPERDWLERWHATLDRYEGTVDIAAVRLLSWCALILALLWGWALL